MKGTTMKARTRTALAVPALSLAALLAAASTAAAADDTTQGELVAVPLNGVEGDGDAMVWVDGTMITVEFAASGLLAGSPHAAHLHHGADAAHECPAADADADGSGTLTTSEGGPSYGEVQVSLTTEGDTSPDSVLAIDRYDTAEGGQIDYQRGEIEVSQGFADAVMAGEVVLVIHGVDHNGNGQYDGDVMSDLDPALPAEATDPALCGLLTASQMDEMPTGGVQTGTGSTAGTENLGLVAGGGAALLAGASLIGAGVLRRRQNARQGA
jgi:hypothetical protein